MKAKRFLPSLILKTVHIAVVISITLSSILNNTNVKRAAAMTVSTNSNWNLSRMLSRLVPTIHRVQTLWEKYRDTSGIGDATSSIQAAAPFTSDTGKKPTPTAGIGIPATPAQTETTTESPLPSATLAPMDTPETTLTPAPSGNETCTTTTLPAETSSPTQAAIEEESTVVPIVSETITLTETTPISNIITTQPGITLTLETTPTIPAPGDIVTLTWSSNWDGPIDDLELLLTLPVDFEPWEIDEGMYDPTTKELQIPITLTYGSLRFQVLPGNGGPYALHIELLSDGKRVVKRTLALPRRELFNLDVSGGRAWGFNKKVLVNFPDGALPEAVNVEIRPPDPNEEHHYLGGRPFEIEAFSQTDGHEVNQFAQPITIEVRYDPAQYGNEENGLKLYYYDESTREWYPLPTRVDSQRHILLAWSDHLTQFDFLVQNWEAARLPNLEAFQVSSFTGASTYSMQFQVPPGPAGLQPSVSLSYNSQIVDGASSRTQSSWVGMGWTMGDNFIRRNQNGTPDYYGKEYNQMEVNDADYNPTNCNPGSSNNWCGTDGDDTFSLVVNGQSWTLIRVPDNDDDQSTIEYRTTSESFWRVIRYHSHGILDTYPIDTSYWYVWDKTGTRFEFGSTSSSRGYYPAYPTGCSSIFLQTWQWSMTKMRNVFGEELTYTYYLEPSPTRKYAQGCIYDASSMILAIYPAEIVYPNNRYKISFINSITPRTDWETNWREPAATVFYQLSLLDHVNVLHNPDGDLYWNSGDEQLIRKYVLGFANFNDTIFPFVIWPQGGKTPTLISITEFGFDGENSLPVTTFTYGDEMHLTIGSNGYGGKMIYDYESSPWYEIDGKGLECSAGGNAGNNIYMDTKPECSALSIDRRWFKPMSMYKISVEVKTLTDGSTAILKMDDGVSIQSGSPLTLTGSYQVLESFFTLSINADQARSILSCTGGGCNFRKYKVIEVTTRYRVDHQTAQDDAFEYGTNIRKYFRYDEPATNDLVHSAFVANFSDTRLLTPAHSEYRGNVMSKEIDTSGKVSTTFFYQDDNRKGSASASLVSTEAFTQPFQSTNWAVVYEPTWGFNGDPPTFPRVTGDVAAQVTNGNSDWSQAIFRDDYTVFNGKVAILQFRLNSTTQQTILALNSIDGGYYRWGLKQVNDTFYVQKCAASSGCDDSSTGTVVLSGVQPGHWYVLVMMVDRSLDNRFLIWVWDRDNPSQTQFGRYEEDLSAWSGKTWRFMMKVNNGTAWLDEYSEGKLYSMSSSFYNSENYTTLDAQLPTKKDGTVYRDVQRTWTYLTESRAFNFDGNAIWTGTRTTNDYNPADQNTEQYGNLTRALEASWDAVNNRWQDYRLMHTIFYPNPTSGTNKNLVGLPAMTKTYACLSTDHNGLCMTGFAESSLTSSQWSLYDTHTHYSDLPAEGKLTGQRTLVECNGVCSTSTEYFSDSVFTYDGYGNHTIIDAYTTKNGFNNFRQGSFISSYSCYGGGTVGGYTCNDDGYHTYVLWQRNVMGHVSSTNYSNIAVYGKTATGYTLSVPVTKTDPNNISTSAEYDIYGRMTGIIRNGDDHTYPTVRISYFDTLRPFYTEVEQRITGTTYYKIQKYYNGVGQLLQTQVVGANVNGVTKDILNDTWYNSTGRVWKKSVSYDVTSGLGYQSRNLTYAYNAQTIYDALGRLEYVYSTDNTYTHYVYKELETEVTDPRGNTTHTLLDVWGRTTWVIPPIGASVHYNSYDTQNRPLQIIYGSNATTNLTYDLVGRKLSMEDPDLGNWSYSYDALGNLHTQLDARGCTITMNYDSINRLTSKSYSGCAITSAPTYTYDSTTGGNKGIGRRTGMTDGSGSTNWTYNERGLIIKETKNITGSGTFLTQWSYNSADLPTSMMYPSNNSGGAGENVTFTYNPQMMLNTAFSSTSTYVRDAGYDASGRIDLLGLGLYNSNSRVNIDYEYYSWDVQGGRLRYLKAGTPSSPTSLQNLTYDYDTIGNIVTIVDTYNSNQKQCFRYDELNRLTKGTTYTDMNQGCTTQLGNGNYDEAYDYDPNTGNLTSKTGTGTYTYGSSLHKHAVTRTSNGWSFNYDNNGNMTTRFVGTSYSYFYDAENRLVSVSGGTTASFYYDGDGVRVRGTVGSTTTAYIGNYFEWTGSTTTMKKYYYAGNTRVAVRIGTNDPLWLMGDHLGSTSQTANYSGTPYPNGWQLYKPWGEKRYPASASGLPTTYRYTGQRQESSLGGSDGLYYYGARWYEPTIGRFNQPDTVLSPTLQGTQAWDRMAYVNNNPMNHTDPTGRDCTGLPQGALQACLAATTPPSTPAPSGFNCAESNYYAPGCSGYQSQQTTESSTTSNNSATSGSVTTEKNPNKVLSWISTISEAVSTAASTIGVGMEATGALIGGPEGFLAGTLLYNATGLNIVSQWSSAISTAASIGNDIVIGKNILGDKATLTSIATTTIGWFSPFATIDLAADEVNLYSMERNP